MYGQTSNINKYLIPKRGSLYVVQTVVYLLIYSGLKINNFYNYKITEVNKNNIYVNSNIQQQTLHGEETSKKPSQKD